MTGLPRSIIKKYGVSKEAWRVFRRRKGTSKSRASPKRVRRKENMARKRRSYRPRIRRAVRRRGGVRGILGGIMPGGILPAIAGVGGLIVAQRYQPFGGAYKPAIDKIALGIALPMIGMDNRDMLSVGIKEGIATVVNQYLGGGAGPTGQGAL